MLETDSGCGAKLVQHDATHQGLTVKMTPCNPPGHAGGGTAIVYAAIDTVLSRSVALKVMQPHGKASVNITAVKREVRTS